MTEARRSDLYRHIKSGHVYFVRSLATHTETGEELVIYTRWDPPDGQVWARPRTMFEDGRFENLAGQPAADEDRA